MTSIPLQQTPAHRWTPGLSTKPIWISLVLCIVLFTAWPGLDLLVARWFYAPGQGFIWRDNPLVLGIYDGTTLLGHLLLGSLLLAAVVGHVKPQWVPRSVKRMAVAALCCALLGPGLLIEVVLKPHWQRPRPVQVQEFGGQQAFVPVLRYCADCQSNHSFVSGHAAAGYALLTLGVLSRPTWRRRWLCIGVSAGAIVGLARIGQGGHFLSDVIFAFFAVWLTAQVVAWAAQRGFSRR